MADIKTLYLVTSLVSTGLSNNLLYKIRQEERAKRETKVRIVVLSEEQWVIHKPFVREHHRILFIGGEKLTEGVFTKKHTKFLRHGVRYGWNGNMAYIRVEKSFYETKLEHELFLKALEKECGICDFETEKKKMGTLPLLGMLAVAVFVPFGYLLVGGKLVKDRLDASDKLRKQKYMYGFTHFMNHGLEHFMNGTEM